MYNLDKLRLHRSDPPQQQVQFTLGWCPSWFFIVWCHYGDVIDVKKSRRGGLEKYLLFFWKNISVAHILAKEIIESSDGAFYKST